MIYVLKFLSEINVNPYAVYVEYLLSYHVYHVMLSCWQYTICAVYCCDVIKYFHLQLYGLMIVLTWNSELVLCASDFFIYHLL